jgi:carboxylate-amine ligase
MTVRRIGVEEELFVVDPVTAVPVPRSGAVRAADAQRPPDAPEEVTHELFLEQVETTTEPAASLDEVRTHVLAARRRAHEDADEAGAALLPSSTAPIGRAESVTPTDRYRTMAERHADLFPAVAVCGMHVHVEVADDHEAVRVVDALGPWLPVVTALAAGSPFANGRDTGYASWRARQWDRWPTAGPAGPFGTIDAYRRTVEVLVGSGAALDEGMLYLDARVGRATPTVEVRVCDVQADPDRAVALAGLLRALVATVAGTTTPQSWPVPVLRAARWAAQRDGLTGTLLDPRSGEAVPAEQAVATLLTAVGPALHERGDHDVVTDQVRRTVEEGGPAQVARGVAQGDPHRWTRHLLRAGLGPRDG